MAVIEVQGLKKVYRVHQKTEGLLGSIQSFFHREHRLVEAVKEITFQIETGEIVGFIGPNGAGKTTTMKMLAGLLYPEAGGARVLGFTPWDRSKDYLRQISFVMGNRNQLWWDIPAMDSFLLNRDIYQIKENHFQARITELSNLLDVSHLLGIPVRNLSLGERMKMELIGALLHSPKVLFLDEPTIGLDLFSQNR